MLFFSLLSNVLASTPTSNNQNRLVVDLIDNTEIQNLRSELAEEYTDFEFELVHPTTNDDALYYVNINVTEAQSPQNGIQIDHKIDPKTLQI